MGKAALGTITELFTVEEPCGIGIHLGRRTARVRARIKTLDQGTMGKAHGAFHCGGARWELDTSGPSTARVRAQIEWLAQGTNQGRHTELFTVEERRPSGVGYIWAVGLLRVRAQVESLQWGRHRVLFTVE